MAAAEGEGGDRAGGVVADARQRDQVVVRRRHLAAVPLHDRGRGGVQPQRASRVAEPSPGAHGLAAGRRRPVAPGVGQVVIQVSKTGSTRATGVCWSMNSETITAHGVAPGPRQGRSRACSAYHRRIGACRSLISRRSCLLDARLSNHEAGASRRCTTDRRPPADYRGAHGLGSDIRVDGCPSASTGYAAASCCGSALLWSSGSASCSVASAQDPAAVRRPRRAPRRRPQQRRGRSLSLGPVAPSTAPRAKGKAAPASPTRPVTCSDDEVSVLPLGARGRRGCAARSRFGCGLQGTQPACTFEVSPGDVVAVKITTGSDRIWSSQDCPDAIPTTDGRGAQRRADHVTVAWSGRRSDDTAAGTPPGRCPGFYHVYAAALGSTPTDVQFEVTRAADRPVVTKTAKPKPRRPSSPRRRRAAPRRPRAKPAAEPRRSRASSRSAAGTTPPGAAESSVADPACVGCRGVSTHTPSTCRVSSAASQTARARPLPQT